MNPLFDNMTLEQLKSYPPISKKKNHKFQFFYCLLKNNIDNPELLTLVKELMKKHYVEDLNSLRFTDDKKDLLMFSNAKVGLFLLENNLININNKDNLGNTFLFYTSKDLLNKIKGKFDIDWNHINNDGDNVFTFAVSGSSINFNLLKKCIENGVNPNHVNNKDLSVFDILVKSRFFYNQIPRNQYDLFVKLINLGVSYNAERMKNKLSSNFNASIVKYAIKFQKNKILEHIDSNIVENSPIKKKRL